MWLNKNFLIEDNNCYIFDNQWTINLKCLRTNLFYIIELDEIKCQLTIQCDSMQMAGEMITSIVNDLYSLQSNNLNLNCTSNFPNEIEQVRKNINQINRLELVRQQLAADLAGYGILIRLLQ